MKNKMNPAPSNDMLHLFGKTYSLFHQASVSRGFRRRCGINKKTGFKVVSIAIIFSLLYSSTILAMDYPNGNREKGSCLSPVSVIPLVKSESLALYCGEVVLREVEGLGIDSTEGFYKNIREGRLEDRIFKYIDIKRKGDIRCLVLVDINDENKRAVYVFDKNSGYFSRITDDEKVQDLLFDILDLGKVAPVEMRKFECNGKKWSQGLFYLEKGYLPVLKSLFSLIYEEEFIPSSYPIEEGYRVKSPVKKRKNIKEQMHDFIDGEEKIKPEHKQIAKQAVDALIDAGIVNSDNIDKVKNLFTKIAEKSEYYAGTNYGSLQALAKNVKEGKLYPVILDLGLHAVLAEKLNKYEFLLTYHALEFLSDAVKEGKADTVILDLGALITIAEKTGGKARLAYWALRVLAVTGVVNKDNLDKVIELLGAIADNAGMSAYETLELLAWAVKDGKADRALLNLELLTKIAEKAGDNTEPSYRSLQSLADAVRIKGQGEIDNIQKLVKIIISSLNSENFKKLEKEDIVKFLDIATTFVKNSQAVSEGELNQYNLIYNIEQFMQRMGVYYGVKKKLPESYEELLGHDEKFYRQFKKDLRKELYDFVNGEEKIESRNKQSAKQAVDALIDAGVINSDNADKAKILLIEIAKNSGMLQNMIYIELKFLLVLLEEVKGRGEVSAILDLTLLITIAEKAGIYAGEAYKKLWLLVKSVKEGKADPVILNLELLNKIAEEACGDTYLACLALKSLAEAKAITKDNLDKVKELLTVIPKKPGVGTAKAYYIELREFAEAIKCKGWDNIINLETLLGMILNNLNGENLRGLKGADILSMILNSRDEEDSRSLKGADILKFFCLLKDFINAGRAVSGGELTQYNLIHNLEQFMQRMGVYYGVKEELPESYEELLGHDEKFYRQFEDAVRDRALVPSLQKLFGKFGDTNWYKLFFGPVLEEIIFRGIPLLVFSLWSSVFGLSLGLISVYVFIKLHHKGKREGAWWVGVINSLWFIVYGLGLIDINLMLVFPILVHIAVNIIQTIRRKPLTLVRAEDEITKLKRDISLLFSIVILSQDSKQNSVDAVDALVKAGIVNEDNISKLREMIFAIAKKEKIEAGKVYSCLIGLVKAVEDCGLDRVVLDLELLAIIAEKGGIIARFAYDSLQSLVYAVAKGRADSVILDLGLFTKIAENTELNTGLAYWGLQSLAEATTEGKIDAVILDLGLLAAITEKARVSTGLAYKALQSLAEAGVVNKDNLDKVKGLFTIIAEKAGKSRNVSRAYSSLQKLAEAIKNKGWSDILNLGLLPSIIMDNLNGENLGGLKRRGIGSFFNLIEYFITVGQAVSGGELTQYNLMHNLNQFMQRMEVYYGVKKKLPESYEKLLGHDDKFYRQFEGTVRDGALVPSLQKLFGKHGESNWYKLLFGPVLEEAIFRGIPILVFSLWSLVFGFSLGLASVYIFIKLHPKGEREGAWWVGIINSLWFIVYGLGLIENNLILVFPVLIHIGVNIIQTIRRKPLALVRAGDEITNLKRDIYTSMVIRQDDKKKAVDAVDALIRTGIVDKNNIPQLWTLIIAIAKRAGDNADKVYTALQELAKAVKDHGLNSVILDFDLLTIIVKRKGWNADKVYFILGELAQTISDAGFGSSASEVLNLYLLKKIAKANADIYFSYSALQNLVSAVKNDGLNSIILNLNLLTKIAERAKWDVNRAYSELHKLAKAVKDDGLNPVILDLNILTKIAESGNINTYLILRKLAKLANPAPRSKERGFTGGGVKDGTPDLAASIILNLELLTKITEKAEGNVFSAFSALYGLAKAVVKNKLDPIALNLNLLIRIAEKTRGQTGLAYHTLRSLTEAGIINKNNLGKINKLFTAIGEKEEKNTQKTYFAIKRLIKAVKEGNLKSVRSIVLDLNLLIKIAEKAGCNTEFAYDLLGFLAKFVNTEGAVVLDLELLITIADKAGKNTAKAYDALQELAKEVNAGNIDAAILDLGLLIKIAERAGRYTCSAYDGLRFLAMAVKAKGLGEVVNIEKLLKIIIDNLNSENLKELKAENIVKFFGFIKDFVNAGRAVSEGELTQYNLIHNIEQFMQRMGVYYGVKEKLPKSYEELLGHDDKFYRQFEDAVRDGALIPSLQKLFGKFGNTNWYKLFFGPVLEEVIFRGIPVLVFSLWSLVFGLSLCLISVYVFIKLHHKGKREGAWWVGVINSLWFIVYGLGLIDSNLMLAFTVLVHIAVNIIQQRREKPLAVLWTEEDKDLKTRLYKFIDSENKIKTEDKQRAKEVVNALIDKAVISEETLNDTMNLLAIIAEKAKEGTGKVYATLKMLTRGGVFNKENFPEMQNLMFKMAEKQGKEGGILLSMIFLELFSFVRTYELNIRLLDPGLLILILDEAGKHTQDIFGKLERLFFYSFTADIKLLTMVAKRAGPKMHLAYGKLIRLAETINSMSLEETEIQDLLKTIINNLNTENLKDLKQKAIVDFFSLINTFITKGKAVSGGELTQYNLIHNIEQFMQRMGVYYAVKEELPKSYEELLGHDDKFYGQFEKDFLRKELYDFVNGEEKIESRSKKSAKQAIDALIDAGVINSDNADKAKFLLIEIAKNSGTLQNMIYTELKFLLEKVKGRREVSAILDLTLLITIAEKAGIYAGEAYKKLLLLVKSVKEGEADPVILNLELLNKIAEEACGDTSSAFLALKSLAEAKAITKDNLDKVKELLTVIPKKPGVGTAKAYYIELREFAEAIKCKGWDNIINLETLLGMILNNLNGENLCGLKSLKGLKIADIEGMILDSLDEEDSRSFKGAGIMKFFCLLKDFVNAGRAVSEGELTQYNLIHNIEQFMQRMGIYYGVKEELPESYEELLGNDDKFYRQFDSAVRDGDLVPSLQKLFGKFGNTNWYKLFFGPVLEEIIFRGIPLLVFSLWSSVFGLSLGLISVYIFIKLHYEGKREGAWWVEIINSLWFIVYCLGLIDSNLMLIFPVLIHIAVNIIQTIRKKSLAVIGSGDKDDFDLQLTTFLSTEITEAMKRGKGARYISELKREVREYAEKVNQLDIERLGSISERERSILFNFLYLRFPSIMERGFYEGMAENSLVILLLRYLRGDLSEFYLTDTDIKELISLSLTLDNGIRSYIIKYHNADPLWTASFRELVRLHSDFIKWYLSSLNYRGKDGRMEIRYTLQYFIMTAMSIYGGMFGKELNEFKKVLKNVIDKHFNLFVKLSLGDKSMEGVDMPKMIDELLYKSYTTLEVPFEKDSLFGVGLYNRTYYSLLRLAELGHPGLFMLSNKSHDAFSFALGELAEKTKGKVFNVPLSYFSERSDLFGMNVPSGKGMEFLEGVLPRLIEQAQNDKEKPIYLVFNNIEAVRGSFRVEFNPVLWEREVVVPELNRAYRIPRNLHIFFTMNEGAVMQDEAFCDRLVRTRIGEFEADDLAVLLKNKYKVTEEFVGLISQFYSKLNNGKWKQAGLLFYPQDFINCIVYGMGKADGEKGGDNFTEEMYRYFILKFRYFADRQEFKKVFTEVFRDIDKKWDRSIIEIKDGKLIADGIEAEIALDLITYAKENSGKTFNQIVLEKYGYVLRETDRQVISQFVRRIRFKDKDISLFTILEGTSGEGKTQLTYVLAKIFGKKSLSYTIHKRSELEELRGGVFPGKCGLEIVNDTPFLQAVEEGGHVINFSELNTNYRQGLVYWMDPVFRKENKRILPEIPAPKGHEGLFYERGISRDNLYIADINPDDYRARGRFPEQVRCFSAGFWMGYDYTCENKDYQKLIHDELASVVEQLFEIYFRELDGKEKEEYSRMLADVFYAVQKGFAEKEMRSLYQVLTMRDIIRSIRLFKYLNIAKKKAARNSFNEAVTDCLGRIWIEDNVKSAVKKILESRSLWLEAKKDTDIVRDVIKSDLGHILLHSGPATDGMDTLKEVLDEKDKVLYMCASDFIELDAIIGGVGVDSCGNLGVYPGSLLKAIEAARMEPERKIYLVIDNFHQLNPDTAVGLNRILQDGKIELPPLVYKALKEKEDGKNIEDYYGTVPENLKIAGISYADPEPGLLDILPMSGAELSRLVNISVSGNMNGKWIENYITEKLKGTELAKYLSDIITSAVTVYKRYEKQKFEGNYKDVRISVKDIDEFLKEILRNKDKIASSRRYVGNFLASISFYTLGCGLRPVMQMGLVPSSSPELGYIEQDGITYLKAGNVMYPTKFETIESAREGKYLVPIDEAARVYESVLSGFQNGRRVMFMEGMPGGGKTALSEDIAKRLGIRFSKVSMYREVELWEFLGSIEKLGPDKFRLTCTKEKEKFLSEFLDYIENGGVFCFDEGNISRPAIQVLSFLMQIMRNEDVELGLYHNGIQLGMHKIKIHPDFKVFVTYNPSGLTKGREKLPFQVDYWGKKIWINDSWSRNSYIRFIEHYLGRQMTEDEQNLIDLHTYMKYILDEEFRKIYNVEVPDYVKEFVFSEFKNKYTYQYAVSPRELIRCAQMMKSGYTLYEAVMLNYLFQFSNPEDFNKAVNVIDKVIPGFLAFLQGWQRDLVFYTGTGDDDKNFFMGVSSQVAALKALRLGLEQAHSDIPAHVMLLSEQGSYPLELIKEYCMLADNELFVFDGNPYVNSVELLAGKMVEFGDLDITGKAENKDKVGTMFGFIGKHLIEEGTPQTKQKGKILYLSSLDALSDAELSQLNDFLNTGKIQIDGKDYVLPVNARIVVDASVMREKHFSSPFFNRFQKIGVPAVTDKKEVFKYLDTFYEGLTYDEKQFIYNTVILLWYMDMGLHTKSHNLKNLQFSKRYGFGLKDVYKLAELARLEKQKICDKGERNIDSGRLVLKCVLRLFCNGLDDVGQKKDKSDYRIFINRLIREVFKYKGIDEKMIDELGEELKEVEREWIEKGISLKELSREPVLIGHNTYLSRKGDEIIIKTPGNTYNVKEAFFNSGELELSDGLKARIDKGSIILKLGIVKSIGGIETGLNDLAKENALPPEETPKGDYIKYTGVINETASVLLWAGRRVIDTKGRERGPIPVVLMGETGAAKSTLVRNISKITGIPQYTLHCFDGMEPDSVIAQMGLAQDDGERKVKIGLKEFFSHLGKIDPERDSSQTQASAVSNGASGKYYFPEGKTEHATRKILFLDEANMSPEILYCLRPLFRGERNFKLQYLGKNFNVELDPEVQLVLAGNPSGSYSGRGSFSWEIIEDAVKLWVPALHRYIKSDKVEKEMLEEVLFGLHKRKMQELDVEGKETEETGAYSKERRDVINLESKLVKMEDLPPDISYVEQEEAEIIDEKDEKAEMKKRVKIRKDISFKYSIEKIEDALMKLDKINDNAAKYRYFLDNILRDYLLALSDGCAEAKEYEKNPKSITNRVLTAVSKIDNEFYNVLTQIAGMYNLKTISKEQVRQKMVEIRRIVLRRIELKRFIFSFPIEKEVDRKQKLFLLAEAEEIKDIVELDEKELAGIGVDIKLDKYKDKIPLRACIVDKHPFMEEAYARGVFKGEGYVVVYGASTGMDSMSMGVDFKLLLSWVAYHELGHAAEHMRGLVEEIASHKNGELFSVLFPLIFGSKRSLYIEKELIRLLMQEGDKNSYYCQAAKGIFNGFLRVLKEENPKEKDLQKLEEITDDFEPDRIKSINEFILKLTKLDEKKIKEITLKLYKNAIEAAKRGYADNEYYLSSTGEGKCKIKSGGDMIGEFTEGLSNPPDVEIVSEAQKNEIEKKIDVSSEGKKPEKEDTPELVPDEGKPGKGEEGKGEGAVKVVEKTWLEDYYSKVSGFARRFIEIFSKEPEPEEVYTASGRKLDLRKFLTFAQRIFKKRIIEEARPNLIMGVTVDVSGSIISNRCLVKGFTNMTKFFISLLHAAAGFSESDDVSFSLSAIGAAFHPVFGFNECKDVEKLKSSITEMWNQVDWNGINTVSLVSGLREKYREKKEKENKVEIVLTDGQETSGSGEAHFRMLREMADDLEKDSGLDVVFIGLGTLDVKNYSRFILLENEPDEQQLMYILSLIATYKVQHGFLPKGDLSEKLGISTFEKDKAGGSLPHAIVETVGALSNGHVMHTPGGEGSGERELKKKLHRFIDKSEKIKTEHKDKVKEVVDELEGIWSFDRENIRDIENLFITISENAGDLAGDVYTALRDAHIAIEKQQLIPYCFKVSLLTAIAKSAGEYAESAYKALQKLAEAGAVGKDNIFQAQLLFEKIAERAKGEKGKAFKTLIALVKTIKNRKWEKFSVSRLEKKLITNISAIPSVIVDKLAEEPLDDLGGRDMAVIFKLIKDFISEGKDIYGKSLEEYNLVHNIRQFLFWGIEYYRVHCRKMPHSYEEILKFIVEIQKAKDEHQQIKDDLHLYMDGLNFWSEQRSYAKKAVDLLIEEGIINKDNIQEAQDMLINIGNQEPNSFHSLGNYILKVKNQGLNRIMLNLKFLVVLAKKTYNYPSGYPFMYLHELPLAVKDIPELETVIMDLDLLIAIAERAGEYAIHAYPGLADLILEVKAKGWDMPCIIQFFGEIKECLIKKGDKFQNLKNMKEGEINAFLEIITEFIKSGKDLSCSRFTEFNVANKLEQVLLWMDVYYVANDNILPNSYDDLVEFVSKMQKGDGIIKELKEELYKFIDDYEAIKPALKKSAKECVDALFSADIACESNISHIKELITEIAKKVGYHGYNAYSSLKELVDEAKNNNLNSAVLDLNLLFTIAIKAGDEASPTYRNLLQLAKSLKGNDEMGSVILDLALLTEIADKTEHNAGKAYNLLRILNEMGIINRENITKVKELFLAIAARPGVFGYYGKLEKLILYVKDSQVEWIKTVVLDIHLLTLMAGNSTDQGYGFLKDLAVAVVNGEINPIILNLDLLTGIIERARFVAVDALCALIEAVRIGMVTEDNLSDVKSLFSVIAEKQKDNLEEAYDQLRLVCNQIKGKEWEEIDNIDKLPKIIADRLAEKPLLYKEGRQIEGAFHLLEGFIIKGIGMSKRELSQGNLVHNIEQFMLWLGVYYETNNNSLPDSSKGLFAFADKAQDTDISENLTAELHRFIDNSKKIKSDCKDAAKDAVDALIKAEVFDKEKIKNLLNRIAEGVEDFAWIEHTEYTELKELAILVTERELNRVFLDLELLTTIAEKAKPNVCSSYVQLKELAILIGDNDLDSLGLSLDLLILIAERGDVFTAGTYKMIEEFVRFIKTKGFSNASNIGFLSGKILSQLKGEYLKELEEKYLYMFFKFLFEFTSANCDSGKITGHNLVFSLEQFMLKMGIYYKTNENRMPESYEDVTEFMDLIQKEEKEGRKIVINKWGYLVIRDGIDDTQAGLLRDILFEIKQKYGRGIFVDSEMKNMEIDDNLFSNSNGLYYRLEEILWGNIAGSVIPERDDIRKALVLYRLIKTAIKSDNDYQKAVLEIILEPAKVLLKELIDLQKENKLSDADILLGIIRVLGLGAEIGPEDITSAEGRVDKLLILYNDLVRIVKDYEEKMMKKIMEYKMDHVLCNMRDKFMPLLLENKIGGFAYGIRRKEIDCFIDALLFEEIIFTDINGDNIDVLENRHRELIEYLKERKINIVLSQESVPDLRHNLGRFIDIIEDARKKEGFAWDLSWVDFMGFGIETGLTVMVMDEKEGKRIMIGPKIENKNINNLLMYGLKDIQDINSCQIIKDIKAHDTVYGCKVDIDSLSQENIEEIRRLQDSVWFYFYSYRGCTDIEEFTDKYKLNYHTLNEFDRNVRQENTVSLFDVSLVKEISSDGRLKSMYYLPVLPYRKGNVTMALGIALAKADKEKLQAYGIWQNVYFIFSGLKGEKIDEDVLKELFYDPMAIYKILPNVGSMLKDLENASIFIRMSGISA